MRSFAKNTLIAAMLSMLATTTAMAAEIGQISFKGNITAAACLINGATKLSHNVLMGDIPMNYLNNSGYLGKEFSLEFTGCSKAPKVTFKDFNATTGVLALTPEQGVAQNVGIVMVYGGQQLMTNKIDNLELKDGAVTISLSAKYKHVGTEPIVAGSANAMTQVDVAYE